LEQDLVEDLYKWIDPIQTQETMMLLKPADWPMLKKESRIALHKELHNQAFPPILRGEPKALTLEEIEKVING
jgi:hypothetical protein